MFPLQTKRLPARDKEAQSWIPGQEIVDEGRRGQDMLEGIQDEQESLVEEELLQDHRCNELGSNPEIKLLGNGGSNLIRFGDGGKIDKPDPVGEIVSHPAGSLDG